MPDFHDYNKHVRLGDVVVSMPLIKNGPTYVHCETITRRDQFTEAYDYTTKNWSPREDKLQAVAEQLKSQENQSSPPWMRYLEEGSNRLHAEESSFHRPSHKKDKLYAVINGNLCQVEHPKPAVGEKADEFNRTRLRYGPIGSSKFIARNAQTRLEFGQSNGIVAYDNEFGAALDAVEGSQKLSYLVVRGISDYEDGTKNKEWQPYAALVAASFTKAVICALPAVRPKSYA